jgi:hypothetical protein
VNGLWPAATTGYEKGARRRELEAGLAHIRQVPFDSAAAMAAARIRVELERQGSGIAPLDMAIAATAVSRGAALVTNNAAEFSRVPGLRVLGNPGKSSACALGFEHGFKAGVHFFFFDKLAALRCGNSFLHGGKETGFFVEIAGNKIGHQPLGDGAGFSGDLGRASLAWQAKPPAPPKHPYCP